MKPDPVTIEKNSAEKAADVLIALGWLLFLTMLPCAPVVVWAVWKALL